MSRGGLSSVTSTSKSTARSLEPDAVWVSVSLALLLILVTRPRNVVSGNASMVTCTESLGREPHHVGLVHLHLGENHATGPRSS